ncbi:MAG: L-seryl-tRNA(Sec) selenium transferase [Chloroflexi bacterium]|nr:L-seryl-tRNA(Sec) selenium transferase [Chloroflexota bacterium]
MTTSSPLRSLPSVDRLLQEEQVQALLRAYPRALVTEAARHVLAQARAALLNGGQGHTAPAALAPLVETHLAATLRPPLRPVINATGVVIHTNLGRAPLSRAALQAMAEVALGYSNLEYDLEAGERGSRHEHAAAILRRVSGAEAALVVNNNASAVLLALQALAAGREVVISRGQLVEIGGGFRIPDVLRQSGARLVEVGTTNRTYAADYERAITSETALLLRVHSSNFRVIGFVHQPTLQELVEVGRRHNLPVLDDLGSGSLLDTARYGLAHEPMVQESVAAGTALVSFSGDKLLGGPQAGLLVGRADLIGQLKRHPLTRALRPDKLTLAALVATLGHYLREEAEREIPVWRMLAQTPAQIGRRARRLGAALPAELVEWRVVDGQSAIGGGSLPGETLPTRLLALTPNCGIQTLAQRLRHATPPVVARIEHDRLVLDLRTVQPEEDRSLANCLVRAAEAGSD